MKRIFRVSALALAAVAALSLAGCNAAMETQVSPNGASSVLIATVDGCRVWRIGGEFHDVYVARCPEGAGRVQNDITEGKSTSIQQTVPAQ